MERSDAGAESPPLKHERITPPASSPLRFDLICLSHLRWGFVYQRPQHLMTRFARHGRVFFVEEPFRDDGPAGVAVESPLPNLFVVTMRLPWSLSQEAFDAAQRRLLDDVLREHAVTRPVLWYYTPMAVAFTRHLAPLATVYDCMDELSAFRGAPPLLREREEELFARADLVFTGGQSLYEAKRTRHPRVHAFPSSVDAAHFAQARGASPGTPEPDDQADIPRPRLGFFGVIDERMDLALVEAVAALRPDWHLVLIGPVVKIDEAQLPRRDNIHYLGLKAYDELPAYLAGWDAALLPFARNESTRFISPTKTPEYLAAGRPVVSTGIRDVVRPYGELGLVGIADEPGAFVAAIEAALHEDAPARIARVDALLADTSWERTWATMLRLIEGQIEEQTGERIAATASSAAANGPVTRNTLTDAGTMHSPVGSPAQR